MKTTKSIAVTALAIIAHEIPQEVGEFAIASPGAPEAFKPYLTWKSREYGVPTRFIELAGEINVSMPRYVIGRLEEALDRHLKVLEAGAADR